MNNGKNKLATVDLFAGGGGLSFGFANAGFNIVHAFDNWDPAIGFYRRNLLFPISELDLSCVDALSRIRVLKPDVIIGGPPCQDFSSAGKRDETLGRANLTLYFANIISGVRPEYFVMENVDRSGKSRTYAKALDIFRTAGYALTIKVLNANRCGAPQSRKRLFTLGHLNGPHNFLSESLDRSLSPRPMTLRDYFGDSLGIEHYYRHPRSYMRRGVFSIDEPSPTIRGVNRPVPGGYKNHPRDSARLSSRIRPLTTRERSMIQTFPKDIALVGSKTELEQIIGNAVPVKLAEHVAKRLMSYHNGQLHLRLNRYESALTPALVNSV